MLQNPSAATQPQAPQAQQPERVVPEGERQLVKDYLDRIKSAVDRHGRLFKEFDNNRKRLRGFIPGASDGDQPKRYRTNLFFSNLASMRPQVYAKDPEYSVTPTKGVPQASLNQVMAFCATAEIVLHKVLVKDAKLKKRMKRQLTACYTTSIGWSKACWQETTKKDPEILDRLKDTQDNIDRIQRLRSDVDDPEKSSEQEKEIEKLRQALEGLQTQAEVTVSRGTTYDFVMSEDVVILDESVLEVGDYLRASAIAHRVWMTPDAFEAKYGYKPKKGKTYTDKSGTKQADAQSGADKHRCLLAVWEIWDQDSNRVITVCEGEEGYCKQPFSPDWTGGRWYPFFLLLFNEVDGAFYPPSDVELITPLVDEYNTNRDDLVRDRKGALPLNVVRKGGALTDADLTNLKNRQGSDIVLIEGKGGKPISDDLWSGTLGQLNPTNYDTAPARVDIEQMLGGGDASRGTVMEAKTATEAEIVAQGLRSRSAERTDCTEDLLSELGSYVLQMCMRKLSLSEVQAIAGEDAVWPELTTDDIFKMVSVEVRGGSTGKPDRLQEQDRWTKVLPVIEKAMSQVAELRSQGNNGLANAVIALVKETLRRFDERVDIEQFLPAPEDGAQADDPLQNPQVQQAVQGAQAKLQELEQTIQQLTAALSEAKSANATKVELAKVDAVKAVEVAKVTAPIEAQAEIEVERIRQGAKLAAQASAAPMVPEGEPPVHEMLEPAFGEMQPEPPEAEAPPFNPM